MSTADFSASCLTTRMRSVAQHLLQFTPARVCAICLLIFILFGLRFNLKCSSSDAVTSQVSIFQMNADFLIL